MGENPELPRIRFGRLFVESRAGVECISKTQRRRAMLRFQKINHYLGEFAKLKKLQGRAKPPKKFCPGL